MSAELLVIVLVAVLAFGPKKLPMLAGHLLQLWRFLEKAKQQMAQFWQLQVRQQELLENEAKAKQAEDRQEN